MLLAEAKCPAGCEKEQRKGQEGQANGFRGGREPLVSRLGGTDRFTGCLCCPACGGGLQLGGVPSQAFIPPSTCQVSESLDCRPSFEEELFSTVTSCVPASSSSVKCRAQCEP